MPVDPDRGDGVDAVGARAFVGLVERSPRAGEFGALDHSGRMHLARRGGDEDVVALTEVAPGGEGLPQRAATTGAFASDPPCSR